MLPLLFSLPLSFLPSRILSLSLSLSAVSVKRDIRLNDSNALFLLSLHHQEWTRRYIHSFKTKECTTCVHKAPLPKTNTLIILNVRILNISRSLWHLLQRGDSCCEMFMCMYYFVQLQSCRAWGPFFCYSFMSTLEASTRIERKV